MMFGPIYIVVIAKTNWRVRSSNKTDLCLEMFWHLVILSDCVHVNPFLLLVDLINGKGAHT